MTTVVTNGGFAFARLEDIENGVASVAVTFPAGETGPMYQLVFHAEAIRLDPFTVNDPTVAGINDPNLPYVFGQPAVDALTEWMTTNQAAIPVEV